MARDGATGLWAAGFVLGAWCISTVAGLWALPPGAVVALLPLQVFLFTGLFITAHDAMHGTVAPRRPRLNDAVGAVASALYAGFTYRRLREAHRHHHRAPGEPGADPDFHDGRHTSLVAWYLTFLARYVRVSQLVVMALAWNVLEHGAGVEAWRLLLVWVVPALLSTVQLFVVGTWLPHRSAGGLPHHARSVDLPPWASFLACYHFGYHREHHEAPGTPWWALPALRARGATPHAPVAP